MRASLVLILSLTLSQSAFSLGRSKNPYREYKANVESLSVNLRDAVSHYNMYKMELSCKALESANTDVTLIQADLESLTTEKNRDNIENVSSFLSFSAFYISSASVSCKSGYWETEPHQKLIRSIAELREDLHTHLMSITE